METRVGEILGEKYRLETVLGRGGMGVVYGASNLAVAGEVAVKVLHRELGRHTVIVERFVREAKAAILVRHPNVVEVLDVGVHEGVPFIVQELLRGVSLAQYAQGRGGRISVDELLEFMEPLLEALGEAHAKGVVHRDLKPENVFLAEQRGRIVPKLLDFGISAMSNDESRVTATGSTMGTPAYMAPEHCRASKDADARSDIWSMGVTIYELLAGRLPFRGESAGALFMAIATDEVPELHTVQPSVGRHVASVVARCLMRDPAARYATTLELLRDLRLARLDTDLAPSTAPPGLSGRGSAPDLPGVPELLLPGRNSGMPKLSSAVANAPTQIDTRSAPASGNRLVVPDLGGPPPAASRPQSIPSARGAGGAVVSVQPRAGVSAPPDLGPLPSSTRPQPHLSTPAAKRPEVRIELEHTPRASRPSIPRIAQVSYPGPLLAANNAEPEAAPMRLSQSAIAVAVLSVVLTAAGLLRRLHEPEGWTLVQGLAFETFAASVQFILSATVAAIGAGAAIVGLRAKRKSVTVGALGVLLSGACALAEPLDIHVLRYMPLGLAVLCLAVAAQLGRSSAERFAEGSVPGRVLAVVLGSLGGVAVFAAVELVTPVWLG